MSAAENINISQKAGGEKRQQAAAADGWASVAAAAKAGRRNNIKRARNNAQRRGCTLCRWKRWFIAVSSKSGDIA